MRHPFTALRLRFAIAVLLSVHLPLLAPTGATALEIEASEFGGTIKSETVVSDAPGEDDLQHSDRLFLFFRGGDPEQMDLLVRGSYEINLDEAYQFDLATLRAAGTLPVGTPGTGALSYRLGRFLLEDESGLLLSQRVDGASFQIDTEHLRLRFAGGYTGLLFPDPAGLYLTATDVEEYNEEDKPFAPAKLIGLVAFGLPNFVGEQRVTFFTAAQVDQRYGLGTGEDRLSTFYPSVVLDGPLSRELFYTVGLVGGVGQVERSIAGAARTSIESALVTAELHYLPLRIEGLNLEGGVVAASGDKDVASYLGRSGDTNVNQFVPLRTFGVGEVLSPDLSNIVVPRLSARIRPFAGHPSEVARNLGFTLSGYGYFRPTSGATSVTPATPDADASYLGSEVNLEAAFRPTSDLGLSLYGEHSCPIQAPTPPLAVTPTSLGRRGRSSRSPSRGAIK